MSNNSIGTTPASNYPNLYLPEQDDPAAPVPFWDDSLASQARLEPGEQLGVWDRVVIAGIITPGIALVQCNKGKRFDIQRPPGAPIPTVVYLGYELAEVIITLRIWTQKQLNRLWALIPYLQPSPTPPIGPTVPSGTPNWPPPVDVVHPSLQMLGISSIHIKHIGALEPVQPKGVWQMRITCLEFKKPDRTDDVAARLTGSQDFTSINHAIKANSSLPASDSANPNPT